MKKLFTLNFENVNTWNFIKRNMLIIIISLMAIILAGFPENNFFLSNKNIGLFQHYTFWIFIISNIYIAICSYYENKKIHHLLDKSTLKRLEESFETKSKKPLFIIMNRLFITIGFCFFIGNSLQNAKIINVLPFDYWDSITYLYSYIITRVYKFYLFVIFFPTILLYSINLLASISEIIYIKGKHIKKYPLYNYLEVNYLCNFCINMMIILVIPILAFTTSIFIIHSRLDITTISTILFSISSSFILLYLYNKLIYKYKNSIIQYKNYHIRKIDNKLHYIHNYIINFDVTNNDIANNNIDFYFKKYNYLLKCKSEIENINNYPKIVKAVITCFSPLIPMLIKILFMFIKKSFNF